DGHRGEEVEEDHRLWPRAAREDTEATEETGKPQRNGGTETHRGRPPARLLPPRAKEPRVRPTLRVSSVALRLSGLPVPSVISVPHRTEVQPARRGDEQVDHRERQQNLPAERHQLVVAVARQRPPHPDVKEQNRRDLDQKPDPAERLGQKRSVPAAEEE